MYFAFPFLSSLSIYFLLVMNMFLFFIMYILDLVYVGVATTIGTLLTILLTQLFLFSKKEIQYKEHYKRLFVEDAVKNVFEDAENFKFSYIVGGIVNAIATVANRLFLSKVNIELPNDPTISLLGIDTR